MSRIAAVFYATTTFLLAVIAESVIPSGGWGDAARIAVLAVTVGGLVVFLGAAVIGRGGLGD